MEKISATVITFNEEEQIGECIDSLWLVADEVIILDSFSTDRTVSIAEEKGAIVKQAPFTGYIEQKNKALSLANYNYVFSLDADERVSKKLAASILKAKKDFKFPAYFMNRYNNYCGRFIKHGLWYPNKKLRLFDKRIAQWGGTNPHDKVVLSSNAAAGLLKGDIIHYTYNSVEEHRRRNEELCNIAAKAIFNSGKQKHWTKIFLSPAWSFIHGYFIRLGFLDGYRGFVIAVMTANQSYLKYHKLRLLQRKEKQQISRTSMIKIGE